MATASLTLSVGQHGNVTLNPTQSGANVTWPGGKPVWSASNANVAVNPDPNTALSADVVGQAVGSSTITIVGTFVNAAGTSVPLTSTVNVTVVAAAPQPDTLGLAVQAVPLPPTPKQP